MSHGSTKIASKGVCIYCRRSGIKLTDEHIVPFFIGGSHILTQASCLECNKITSKFELEVARNLWGDARIAANAPSRRKKNRKSSILLHDPDDRSITREIPYDEYPAIFVFYFMQKAGLLQGLPETIDLSKQWQLKTISNTAKTKAFEEKYPGKLTAQLKHVPDSFARLIAKIGYGQALTLLDIGEFKPLCLPYILGKKKNLSFIVGSDDGNSDPKKGIGYSLNTGGFGTPERIMIVSTVRLLADNPTPNYHIVVGEVIGRDKVTRAIEKLSPDGLEMLPFDAVPSGLYRPQNHWSPSVWPLPYLPKEYV
ncbi:MAG: hypothetical protein COC24_005245 [Alphaproteobacteria bacterium]|nr:hypothetical protein [Alphaproteobacteria bacterium]